MKKNKFFSILSVVLVIVIYAIIDNVYTRFYPLNEHKPTQQSNEAENWRIKHPIFHHTFAANVNVVEDNGYFGKTNLITNSLGFKDKKNREISLEMNDNFKKRIVFIGDSFTEGVLLNYEDTFVGLIEEKFRNKKIQVLNAGVGSYSPSIYFRKIKFYLDKGLKFHNLVVFIDISDVHDEAQRYEYDEIKNIVLKINPNTGKTFKENAVYFLKKNFVGSYYFLNLIHDFTYSLFQASEDNNLKDWKDEFNSPDDFIKFISSNEYKRDQWTINEEIYLEYENGIKKSVDFMKRLKLLCDEHNINLTIAVYPWFTQIYHNDIGSKQEKIWGKFTKENKIGFINFFPIFINKDSTFEERYKIIKKNYIPFDYHFNKKGNKTIANFFIKEFEKYLD